MRHPFRAAALAAATFTLAAAGATGALAAGPPTPADIVAPCTAAPLLPAARQSCGADAARQLEAQANAAWQAGDKQGWQAAVDAQARALGLAVGTSDNPGPIIQKVLGAGDSATLTPTQSQAEKAPGKPSSPASAPGRVRTANANVINVYVAAGETKVSGRPTAVGHVSITGGAVPQGALYVAEYRYSGGWYIDNSTTDFNCGGIGCLDTVASHSLVGKYYAFAHATGTAPPGYTPPTYSVVNQSLVVQY